MSCAKLTKIKTPRPAALNQTAVLLLKDVTFVYPSITDSLAMNHVSFVVPQGAR